MQFVGIILFIAAICCAFLAGCADIYDERQLRRGTWLFILTFVFAIIATMSVAFARWENVAWEYKDYPLTEAGKKWIRTQHNKKGTWCCDESDGHPFQGDYTLNQDGSVTLHLGNGVDHHIPNEMVLTEPGNPIGAPIWWYIETGGQHRDYCFALGTLN